jgi:putative membrane protein
VLPDAPASWTTWTADLPAVVTLVGLTALYLRGYLARRDAGRARPRRLVLYLAGVLVVLVAVVTPIATVSGELLWVHMIQHLLMTVVAAPLIALGAPVATIRQGLSPGPRHTLARASRSSRRLRRRLGGIPPLVLATLVHILVTWGWHAPPLYDLAVRVDAVHALEHAAFLGTAVWVWAEIVATARRTRRYQALATLCLGALIAQGGVLGALLTFAGRSVFDVYTGAGGLTALEDQQFAGALMWVPPGFVYAVVAVRRFTAWIDGAEVELRAREAREARERRRQEPPPTDGEGDPDDVATTVEPRHGVARGGR